MRMRTKVNVSASADLSGKDKLFALDDGLAETVLDGFQEITSGTAGLAALGTFNVPFGGISDARGCFLKVTGGDCTLSINGGPTLSIKRGVNGTANAVATSAKVFLEAGLLSLTVVAGSAAVTLTWIVWGDPVA